MDEKIKAALAAYESFRRSALAATPLSGMEAWVCSGTPPSVAELRAAGLDGRSEPRSEAEAARDFDLRSARQPFITDWGFSIPCAEAVEALRKLGPIVEIGAGTGYWTALLRSAGIDAIATDKTAIGDLGYGFEAGRRCDVQELSADAAVVQFPDRAVFCSWPTEGDDWALLAASQILPGRCIALVGGSKTGTPDLDRFLAANFDQISEIDLPQFPGCDDRLVIHRRR